MTEMTRRKVVTALAMVAAAGGALAMTPVKDADRGTGGLSLDTLVPAAFEGWRVDDAVVPVLPDPEAQALLDELYNQTLSRSYVNEAGERIMLVVAYGGDQSDGLAIHRPEVCYGSQGFQIRGSYEDEVVPAPGLRLPVKRLHAVKGLRHEPITYWMRVGDEVVLGSLERKLAQLAFGFRRRIPDGVLVRVSSLDREPGQAFGLHDRFIGALLAALPENRRALLLGVPGDRLG